jgi:glycerol uptake facilitator-like aquaporin
MSKRIAAEFVGTLWLVLGGCGSAVLAATFPDTGIGWLGVSLAFGLTVLTMVYAIGPISGAHLNPAVSLGLWIGGRFKARELPGYIIAQVVGGIVGAGILYVIASGSAGFSLQDGFAANGYGAHSPGQYSLLAGAVTEIIRPPRLLGVVLYAATLLSFLLVGVANSADGKRDPFASLLFALAYVAVLMLVVDLDRPQQGLLTVSQTALSDLLRQMGVPSP